MTKATNYLISSTDLILYRACQWPRPISTPRVQAIRSFNRFYTKQIGVLREGLLKSPFSLTEVRVLYEIAHREKATASELCKELDLDPGYLSRILTNFEKRGLIDKSPSEADGRQSLLSLTQQGQKTLAPLEARSNEEVAAMLGRLSEDEQKRLVGCHALHQRACSPPRQTLRSLPIFCAPTNPETWAGSSTATACFTRKSMDTTSTSRR